MNTKNPTLTVAQLQPTVRARSSEKVSPVAQQVTSVHCIKSQSLTDNIVDTWLDLFERSSLNSPYYHPSFTRAVDNVRHDVEIGLLKNKSNEVIGILPFQRETSEVIAPIGGRMNDFHCIIANSNLDFEWKWLLDQVGAKQFKYHAWTSDSQMAPEFSFEKVANYYVDLSDGFDDYRQWAIQNSSTLKRLPQKIRSLNRRVGEIRFEFDCRDENVLEQLIDMKRAKFRRTNTFDILSVDWAANLLREVFQARESGFQGLLSALWAGKHLVAAHFGMVHNNVLQYWFPVFNPKYSKYSPGLQLMMNSCHAAVENRIHKIDMSYGKLAFKDKFCNRTNDVLVGLVDTNRLRHSIAEFRYHTRMKLKSLPFKESLKVGFRKCFPNFGSQHFK